MLIRGLITLLLVLAGMVAAPAFGAPGNCPPGTTPVAGPDSGLICIRASDPGGPGNPGGEEPGGGGNDGCKRANGQRIPCVTDWGVWVASHHCYAHPITVPPDYPAWEGHTDGEVWFCEYAFGGPTTGEFFWVPPGGPLAAPPDPETLARDALGTLQLATADLQLAPSPPNPAVVGIENWLWVPSGQWETLRKTVAVGATSVSVAAVPEQVLWDMGPGSTTCFEAGRPWTNGLGDGAVTRCGYTYDRTSQGQPSGEFVVAATIRYAVTWTCSGSCTSGSGSLGLVDGPTGTGSLRVVQRQTVVVQ